MYDKFEGLEKAMCMELETLERKVQGGTGFTMQDLETIDKLAHALKSLVGYKAMKGNDEYEHEGNDGLSGRRTRYMSRDSGRSYEDGYSRGYSEAMSGQRYPNFPRW